MVRYKTNSNMTPVATAVPHLPSFRLRPLKGVRILSLALNLPGPAALMRLRAMGARCIKLEPPGPPGASGDPMGQYRPAAYAQLHEGIKRLTVDLKTPAGQQQVHRLLARTDVLITSFRPSAMRKLGLGWPRLHRLYPALSQIAIVGSPGERAEEPGHDLTYLAENGLITGLELPPTLFADMGGSVMASEAVLQATLARRSSGRGVYLEIALSDAASYLALPRAWGLTLPEGMVGGAHAGYRVYPCRDGRVAVAALEPHFAQALCAAAGVDGNGRHAMSSPVTHQRIAAFLLTKTRKALDRLAQEHDIPLHTMPM
ncbi:MAG: Far-related protein [Burkholderiaceae bacterium]|jgi:crotonobetainyl-CoA:carnitine CoA-transferase CaiB-like acyl-CoA transferase|nr:MAG: Far-related protein [Burkholderiaceae bacterium]